MKHLSLAKVASLTLLIAVAVPANPASARSVNNGTASNLLSQCLLESDAQTALGSTRPQKVACCSRSLGYCVTCRTDGTGRCNRTSFSLRPAAGFRPVAPGSVVVAPRETGRRPSMRLNRGTLQRN
jgi:hypothetical protein